MNEELDSMGDFVDGAYVWKRNDVLSVIEYQDGSTRPYTAEEMLARDLRIEQAALRAEFEATKAAVKLAIAELNGYMDAVQLVIDMDNATIKSNPAPAIKDIARAVKRGLGTTKDLAKLL